MDVARRQGDIKKYLFKLSIVFLQTSKWFVSIRTGAYMRKTRVSGDNILGDFRQF